jgi:hypothetical protein
MGHQKATQQKATQKHQMSAASSFHSNPLKGATSDLPISHRRGIVMPESRKNGHHSVLPRIGL